jgi:hypothetical protein
MPPVKGSHDKNPYLVGVLAWLIPGAGHWFLGRRRQAVIMGVSIVATFVLGVLLGGIEMIGPQASVPWFLAQILTGIPAIIGVVLQNPNLPPGVGRGVDLGQVYSGVAGLLNLLCVLDALGRNQASPAEDQSPSEQG